MITRGSHIVCSMVVFYLPASSHEFWKQMMVNIPTPWSTWVTAGKRICRALALAVCVHGIHAGIEWHWVCGRSCLPLICSQWETCYLIWGIHIIYIYSYCIHRNIFLGGRGLSKARQWLLKFAQFSDLRGIFRMRRSKVVPHYDPCGSARRYPPNVMFVDL